MLKTSGNLKNHSRCLLYRDAIIVSSLNDVQFARDKRSNLAITVEDLSNRAAHPDEYLDLASGYPSLEVGLSLVLLHRFHQPKREIATPR
jgi:hypothetical protein